MRGCHSCLANFCTNFTLEHWTIGALDYRTSGPVDHWTIGPLDHWIKDKCIKQFGQSAGEGAAAPARPILHQLCTMDHWSTGASGTIGPLEHWPLGPPNMGVSMTSPCLPIVLAILYCTVYNVQRTLVCAGGVLVDGSS